MDLCLSNQEMNFLIDGVEEGIRNDGRGLYDYRPIFLETGVLLSTNGSARVRIGLTDLIVGVKSEMTLVENSETCINRLKFFVDFTANAGTQFEARGGNEFAEEISKLFQCAYDHDNVLPDFKRLILAKTHMWTIFVDIVILQYGGNIIDAASIGVKTALWDTQICEVIIRPADEGKVMLDLPEETQVWRFDISKAPLIISVNKIGKQCVLDADENEEACSSSYLFVAVEPPEAEKVPDEECLITCVRKSKGGSLEPETVSGMINIAVREARNLNNALMARLAADKIEKAEDPYLSIKTFLR